MSEEFLFGSSYENGNEDDPPRDRPAPLAGMLALRSIGMNVIRAWHPLDRFNPAPGVYRYEYFDRTAAAIVAAGMKLYVQPLWAPEHACEGKKTHRSYTRGISSLEGGGLHVDWSHPDASEPGTISRDWSREMARAIGERWGSLMSFCAGWNETAVDVYNPWIHLLPRDKAVAKIIENFELPFFEGLRETAPHVVIVGPEAAEHGTLHEHLMQTDRYEMLTTHPYAGWFEKDRTFPGGSFGRIDDEFRLIMDGEGFDFRDGRGWLISEISDEGTGQIVPFMREAISRYRSRGLAGISSHDYRQWFEAGTWDDGTYMLNEKALQHRMLASIVNGRRRAAWS